MSIFSESSLIKFSIADCTSAEWISLGTTVVPGRFYFVQLSQDTYNIFLATSTLKSQCITILKNAIASKPKLDGTLLTYLNGDGKQQTVDLSRMSIAINNNLVATDPLSILTFRGTIGLEPTSSLTSLPNTDVEALPFNFKIGDYYDVVTTNEYLPGKHAQIGDSFIIVYINNDVPTWRYWDKNSGVPREGVFYEIEGGTQALQNGDNISVALWKMQHMIVDYLSRYAALESAVSAKLTEMNEVVAHTLISDGSFDKFRICTEAVWDAEAQDGDRTVYLVIKENN